MTGEDSIQGITTGLMRDMDTVESCQSCLLYVLVHRSKAMGSGDRQPQIHNADKLRRMVGNLAGRPSEDLIDLGIRSVGNPQHG